MCNLKLDSVDLLAVHGINNAELLDFTLRKGGCMEVCRQIQREGRARFIGFSTHATEAVISAACASGEFDYVNLHWYFVNDLNWPSVQEATRQDMGVFIISPSDKGGMLYNPPAKLIELCRPLSPIAFNDLYCLARQEVHTLSVGAARPQDFDEHVAALKHYDDIAATIAPVEARLRAAMNESVGTDWCSAWPQGLPEYHDLPGEVNVLEILRLWTYARSLDLVEWGKMRYNLLGNGGHWFPGENFKKVEVSSLQPHLIHSPFAERLPTILNEAHEMLIGEEKKRLSKSD
jgi:predicted aldo/keto reductase-like oxidoreductase